MGYRFKAKESIEQGVRRIALEEAESAAVLLRAQSPQKRDTAVHEARKSIKKIRALLRLIRPEIGAKAFHRENTAVRKLGRRLSPLRDATVLIETAAHLPRDKRKASPNALKNVKNSLEQAKQKLYRQVTREDFENCAAEICAAGERIGRLFIGGGGFERLASGLKRTYRDGRAALVVARRKHDATSYHTLRKRVKDHWYHIRLLESVWTELMQAHEASLKELESALGEDHNLCVLSDRLRDSPQLYGGKAAVKALEKRIDSAQKELREKSLLLAERVFAERPGAFVENVAELWQAWRRQPASMKL